MPTLLTRKTDWILRKALPEDKENIISFFKEILWQTKNNSDLLYQWKYEENPAGDTLALIGVNEEKRVIATSMFMPVYLSFGNRVLKAYQWVDLSVALKYRGQAIADKSLWEGLVQSREGGYAICFAFPNDNSIPLHKRNNGIHLGAIKRYTKPLNVEYLAKRKIKSVFLAKIISFFVNPILKLASKETYSINLGGFRVEKAENCQPEFDNLWDRFSKMRAGQIMTCKNSAYLNWKYLSSPAKNRRLYAIKRNNFLEGFVVLEAAEQIGYIVDILATSENALSYLLCFSIKYFRKQRKNSVVFMALENNIYLDAFKSFGFIKRPEDKRFYIYLDENLQDKEKFTDSRNWFITIGDCDIENM